MTYRITGLDPAPYRRFWGASDASLADHGILRFQVDATPGFPDRITMEDAPTGSHVLLMGHISQPASTPYRARHAIFVLEGAEKAYEAEDALPPAMLRRTQSLRAFDAGGMMLTADIAEGPAIGDLIARFFDDAQVAEIHSHNARQGCFMARITRA